MRAIPFYRRSISAIGLLLGSMVATPAAGQGTSRGTAPSGSPTEGGLLLGFESSGTVLVVRAGDSLRVAWTSPYLVVPRPDGYWFAMDAGGCTLDLDSQHGGGGLPYSLAFVNRYSAQQMGRAGDSVSIRHDGTMSCDAAETEVVRVRDSTYQAALAVAKGDSGMVDQPVPGREEEGLDCIVESDQVSWLSPSAVSMVHRYSQTENCSPGGYTTSGSYSVTQIGSKARVKLRPMLPPRIRRAAERARRGENDCTRDDGPERLDDSWGVFRREGRWIADIWLDGANACRGGREYDLALSLPRAFTGERALPMRWSALKRRFKDASDALLSPSGTVLAVLRGDSVAFHRVAGSRTGGEIGRAVIPRNEAIVMAVWATPAEAAKWRRELPLLSRPVVRVIPPSEPQ